jgi:hypothetical protein
MVKLKYFKIHLIVFLNLLIILPSYSQVDTIKSSFDFPPRFAVKISILSYFDLTPSYQFACEYKVFPDWTLQNEIGYITTFGTPYYQSGNWMSGVRIRNELRHYFHKNSFNESTYFAPEILFKYNSENIERTYLRYNGAYTEKIRKKVERTVIAAHLKIGTISTILSSRVFTDFSCGIGIRYGKQNTSGLPDDAEIFEFSFDRQDSDWLFLSLVFGFKIGYIIK